MRMRSSCIRCSWSWRAVEKQIQDLVEKQAQLRERRAALETSRADTHKPRVSTVYSALLHSHHLYSMCFSAQAPCTQDAIFPDVLHSGTRTPWTLGAAAAEDASQAPGNNLSPLRRLWSSRSPLETDGTRRCDCRRLHRPAHPCYVS